jgi:predicted transcriptional regulator
MGATQGDLARELWVSEQTIANYEKGKTDAGPCRNLADRALRFLFLAHVADDATLAEELRLEAGKLMRPSQRHRRAPRAGPWLAAA